MKKSILMLVLMSMFLVGKSQLILYTINSQDFITYKAGWNYFDSILAGQQYIPVLTIDKSDSVRFITNKISLPDNFYVNNISFNSTQLSKGPTAFGWGDHHSAGYLTSIPPQSFSSITGKPTSLSGYGIIDAYPLSGNPSGFISSVPPQSWSSITGKPSFATVATSGSYNDLSNKPSIPTGITYYNQSGTVSITKTMTFTISPSTASGYSIDISAAGFSTVNAYAITAVRNTASAGASPNVSVKTVSNTAIVVNIVEANTTTQNVLINLLGGVTTVLNGTPMVFANTTGLSLSVVVYGN